jgi:hypothetical protein
LIEWYRVASVVNATEREVAELTYSSSDISCVDDNICIARTVPAREI